MQSIVVALYRRTACYVTLVYHASWRRYRVYCGSVIACAACHVSRRRCGVCRGALSRLLWRWYSVHRGAVIACIVPPYGACIVAPLCVSCPA